jgi:hypothetical protein
MFLKICMIKMEYRVININKSLKFVKTNTCIVLYTVLYISKDVRKRLFMPKCLEGSTNLVLTTLLC